jgi:SAM-dependent methyltransferase
MRVILTMKNLCPPGWGDMRILDVGCGRGRFAGILGSEARYVGLDYCPSAIELARRAYPAVEFHESDATQLPFEDASFELACSWGSLEHIGDIPKALREIRRILRPGGILYLEAPNLFFLGHFLRYSVMRKSPWSGQVIEHLAGYDGWRELLESLGFSLLLYKGRTYYRGWKKPIAGLVWNLADLWLPHHIRENHCFYLSKGSQVTPSNTAHDGARGGRRDA